MALAILFAIGVSNCDHDFFRQRIILEIFLFFLLGVSFVELLFKDTYQNVFLPLLNGQKGYYMRTGTYGLCIQGFTIGISKNGLWMSIGFILYLSKIISGRRKTKDIILFFLYLVMIFCTGKRSYSLIAIAIILWSVLLMHRGEHFGRKIMIIIVIILALCVGIIFLSRRLPALNTSIVRSLEFLEEGDISDGRYDTYLNAIADIPHNPFGVGIDVTGLHNSYLQIILELGWLGGSISLYGLVCPFVIGVTKLKRMLNLTILSDRDRAEIVFSILFQALILLAGFVAQPFLWHDVIMLFMISQFAMLRIYSKYSEALADNAYMLSKKALISKYIR